MWLLGTPLGAGDSAWHQRALHKQPRHRATSADHHNHCRPGQSQCVRGGWGRGGGGGSSRHLSHRSRRGRGLPGGPGCGRSSPGTACWSPAGRRRPAAGACSSVGPCHLESKRGVPGPPGPTHGCSPAAQGVQSQGAESTPSAQDNLGLSQTLPWPVSSSTPDTKARPSARWGHRRHPDTHSPWYSVT